jgi:general secretion pathway protein C
VTPLAARSLIWIAAGLAATSIAIAAAPVARHLAGESGLPAPVVPAAPPAAEAIASVDAILAWSPFGRMAEPLPVAATSLGLTLHGVVLADMPNRSAAIVSPASGPATVFAVGQEVAPGASLAEVHGDRIVLLIDGAPEILGFPEVHRETDPIAGPQALATDDPAAVPGEVTLPTPFVTDAPAE